MGGCQSIIWHFLFTGSGNLLNSHLACSDGNKSAGTTAIACGNRMDMCTSFSLIRTDDQPKRLLSKQTHNLKCDQV